MGSDKSDFGVFSLLLFEKQEMRKIIRRKKTYFFNEYIKVMCNNFETELKSTEKSQNYRNYKRFAQKGTQI